MFPKVWKITFLKVENACNLTEETMFLKVELWTACQELSDSHYLEALRNLLRRTGPHI